MSESKPAISKLRQRKERHQRRGRVYRIAFAAIGVVVIVAGLLLSLPGVPGPGILLIALGLAMLALEFDRAERLLERIIDRVEAARARPLREQVLLAGAGIITVIGVAVAIFVFDVPLRPW